MTKLVIALLLSILSFISFTTSIDVSNKDINWWCSKTPYPDLCRTHVKPHYSTSSESDDNSDFRTTAIEATMGQALRAQGHNKGLGKKCRNRRERAAWADCLQLYQNTIIELNQTVDPNLKHNDEDTQTWLSTALTNLESCRNGFVELGVSDFVLPQMVNNNVSQLVSNALAINKIVSASTAEEETSTDGSPSYVTAGVRKLLQTSSTKANLVVAKDGSGNYRTVTEAIAAASDMQRTGTFIIYVKAGTYKENVVIGNSLKNIMLIGDGMRYTFITASRSVVGGSTTFNSATFIVTGEGFIARGITFRNTAGPENHQAVAVRSGADKSVFYRCGFEGYQDTLYVHSQRQFYKECYIYGTVDFIFGNAAAMFQSCMIFARKPMSGQQNMVTAQGRTDPNQNTGISIHASRIMAAADLRPVLSQFRTYLGRPWKEYSRTVYMQNYIDTLIDPVGWSEWDGNFALDTLYYGEYKNTGPGSSTSNRVKWGGYHVITSSSVATQYTVNSFIDGGSWLPATGVPYYPGL